MSAPYYAAFWAISAMFTIGLVGDDDDHWLVSLLILLIWPVALGRWVKDHAKKKKVINVVINTKQP